MSPIKNFTPSLFFFAYSALTLAPSTLFAQELGIFYTSPEEREYLDLLRQDFLEESAAANFNIDAELPPPLLEQQVDGTVQEFYLNAIMSTSNSSKTIWLNGAALSENELPSNISLITEDLNLALLIKSENGDFIIKPGQGVNVDTGIIQNAPATQSDETTEEEIEGTIDSPAVTSLAENNSSTPPTNAVPPPPEGSEQSPGVDMNNPIVIQALEAIQGTLNE